MSTCRPVAESVAARLTADPRTSHCADGRTDKQLIRHTHADHCGCVGRRAGAGSGVSAATTDDTDREQHADTGRSMMKRAVAHGTNTNSIVCYVRLHVLMIHNELLHIL